MEKEAGQNIGISFFWRIVLLLNNISVLLELYENISILITIVRMHHWIFICNVLQKPQDFYEMDQFDEKKCIILSVSLQL